MVIKCVNGNLAPALRNQLNSILQMTLSQRVPNLQGKNDMISSLMLLQEGYEVIKGCNCLIHHDQEVII